MHSIDNNDMFHWIAVDPIKGRVDIGQCTETQKLKTGLNLMVIGSSLTEVCDLMFSEYEFEDDEELELVKSYTLRPIDFSINYTESNAVYFAGVLTSLDWLFVNPEKHPTEDNWALPWNLHIFNNIEEGSMKDALLAQSQASLAAGNRKTISEMIELGWT